METARGAVELARTLRGTSGLKVRQPLGRMWLALPGGDGVLHEQESLLALIGDEVNVRTVELIDDESDLVERRVKPLLPVIGRKLGSRIPDVMAAAREGRFEIRPDGSVALAGVILAPDEVEVLASPRPGTAVAADEGMVVVIDTAITPELQAEGDVRELTRAVQDLRREAELALDDRIEVWLTGLADDLSGRMDEVAADTLADAIALGVPPAGSEAAHGQVRLSAGSVSIALRRVGEGG
jgi:isoleucyl-tRNA synthetase